MSEFHFASVCIGCGAPQRGRLVFDERMQVVDSDGGVLFADGWKCHTCLGQPRSSAELVINLGVK